jgi:hypothetical protein
MTKWLERRIKPPKVGVGQTVVKLFSPERFIEYTPEWPLIGGDTSGTVVVGTDCRLKDRSQLGPG